MTLKWPVCIEHECRNVDLATQIMDDVYNDFHFRWQIYRLFIVQQTCVTDFEIGTES